MKCSFNKDLLSIYHMLGTVLGHSDKNKTRHDSLTVNLQFIVLKKS